MAKNSKRILVGILLCIILFAVLSSVFCISVNACHDCIGEGCAICAQVATAESALKKFFSAGITTVSTIVILSYAIVTLIQAFEDTKEGTLVTQKIKMLN